MINENWIEILTWQCALCRKIETDDCEYVETDNKECENYEMK